MIDHYKILEINTNSTNTDIKKAFRRLAIKYHPDKNRNSDSSKFINIKNAYDILIDSSKRANYDLQLKIFREKETIYKHKSQSSTESQNTRSNQQYNYQRTNSYNSKSKTYNNKNGRNNYQSTDETERLKYGIYFIGIVFSLLLALLLISQLVKTNKEVFVKSKTTINTEPTYPIIRHNQIKEDTVITKSSPKNGDLKF